MYVYIYIYTYVYVYISEAPTYPEALLQAGVGVDVAADGDPDRSHVWVRVTYGVT